MIRFGCPGCPATFTVDDDKAGLTGKCPQCNSQFVIPNPNEIPANSEPSTPVQPPALPNPTPTSPDDTRTVEIEACPRCNTALSVEQSDLGSEIACPQCEEVFIARRSRSASSEPRQSRQRDSRRRDPEDRPSRRTRRRRDDDDEDLPRSKRPGEVQAIAIMLLVGGILGILINLIAVISSGFLCCVWPGTYYVLVVSILNIIRSAGMLSEKDRSGPPKTNCILQIICIVNLDVPNLVMGIVGLVLLGNPKVMTHYRRLGYSE